MKVVAVMRTLALTVIIVYLQSFQSGTISKCCRQCLSLAVSTASCTYLATDPLFRVLTAEVLLSVRAGIVLAWWVYHWDVLLLFMEGRKWQKPERTGRQYSWLAFQSPGSEKNRGWSRNTCTALQSWPLSMFQLPGFLLSYLSNDGDTQTLLLGFLWVLNISPC